MRLTEDTYQQASFWGTVFLCGAVIVTGTIVAISDYTADWHLQMLHDHFAAIVGLPSASAGAFIIVTLFRQVAGPIEIEVWGLKLKGAGGPVLLWVVCFLALAFALWMVWDLKS
jgi:hypothetical protein